MRIGTILRAARRGADILADQDVMTGKVFCGTGVPAARTMKQSRDREGERQQKRKPAPQPEGPEIVSSRICVNSRHSQPSGHSQDRPRADNGILSWLWK